MPRNSPVDKMYEAMKADGMDKGKAARIAQSRTGLALATGKPPKSKTKKPEPIKSFMTRRNKKEGKG